jgi:phenylacetate-CoA ligase
MRKSSILLRAIDLAKGTNVYSWYRFFQKTLSWDRKQVESYQSERLQQLIQHAWKTTPYYRSEFDRLGLKPGDIESASDLKKMSILDRDTIHDNMERMLSSKFSIKNLHKGSSSGTTGIPIKYYINTDGLSAGIAAGYVLWSMSGWEAGQRNVHIWGNENSIKRWRTLSSRIKTFFFQQKNIASTQLNNPDNTEKLVQEIIQFKPKSIEGYTSSIYTLAQHFQSQTQRLENLEQVLTTAENLEPHQRELIEAVFAPIGDLYGSGEVLGVATKPLGDDRYFVLAPHVIVETEETGIPGMKDLLLTDLNNYGMPMIRYKIGDMVDELHKPTTNAKYPFNWFKSIQGRSSDIIVLSNEKKFHPINIFGGTSFRKFTEITRHKVVWDGVSLKFIFEVKSMPDQKEVHTLLQKMVNDYNVPFSIEYTGRLSPSASGKYKFLEIVENTPVQI